MNVNPLVAAYDAVYAGLESSPTLERLWREHALGNDYPAEIGRILRPGGRVAFTAFEVNVDRVSRLPVFGLDPINDFRPVLAPAGLSVDVYEETERWRDRVTATYQAIMREIEPLRVEMGSFASAALAFEATATLEQQIVRRRVFVVATRRPA